MLSRQVSSRFDDLLTRFHPLLILPVFLSVLLGSPPLWAAWTLALIPFALKLIVARRLFKRTPFDIAVALSTAGFLLGYFAGPGSSLAFNFINTYLACVALFYTLADNDRASVRYWFVVSALIFAVLAFLTLWTFQIATVRHVAYNDWVFRLASHLHWGLSMGSHTNTLGVALAVVIPSLAGIALFRQKTWLRWVAGILAVLFLAILAFSASPGGWAAASIGLLGVLAVLNWKACTAFLAALGAVAFTLMQTQPPWLVKLFTPLDTLNGRLGVWQATVDSLRHFPWLGFGLGGWSSHVPAYVAIHNNPHNAYLSLYCDMGLASVLVIAAGFIAGIIVVRRILRSSRRGLLYGAAVGVSGGLFAFAVHSMVEVNTAAVVHLGGKTLYFAVPLVWLWLAFLVVLDRNISRVRDDAVS